MSKRDFVLLAHDYSSKHFIAGWMISEKKDGTRCLWDGGVSRGLLVEQIPWANVEKNARYVQRQYATGLWSRYGNAIQAPSWFLDQLPTFPLDGELWAGRGKTQFVRSTVSRLEPGHEWRQIKYMIIDAPYYKSVFADGVINNTNYRKTFKGIVEWFEERSGLQPGPWLGFEYTYKFLQKEINETSNLQIIEQIQLPYTTDAALVEMDKFYNQVLEGGGEGIVLRKNTSSWVPERSWNVLKSKPEYEEEGIVIGYTSGRETDKGSKLIGLMGSLVLDYKGKVFELSGFTESEREMSTGGREWGLSNPGKRFPAQYYNPRFPIGSTVTFRYRELTDIGLPKEAKFDRNRYVSPKDAYSS